jgi:hypothetical protein
VLDNRGAKTKRGTRCSGGDYRGSGEWQREVASENGRNGMGVMVVKVAIALICQICGVKGS